MSEYVKVPRNRFDEWQHKSWADMVHAAESHADGLEYGAPSHQRWTGDTPKRGWFAAGDIGDLAYADAQKKHEQQKDHAFYHEGTSPNNKGMACLYQQNW